MNLIYEDQVFYAKPKNEVLFVKNKTPLREIEYFLNSTFMVQLSQILNIRHLGI